LPQGLVVVHILSFVFLPNTWHALLAISGFTRNTRHRFFISRILLRNCRSDCFAKLASAGNALFLHLLFECTT